MLISRKRYEEELEKARMEGYRKAVEERNINDSFRTIHERLDGILSEIEQMKQPKTVAGLGSGVKSDV